MKNHLPFTFTILLVIVLFFGCSVSYQTPFITVFDQQKIQLGSTPETILSQIGYPSQIYFADKNTKVYLYYIKGPINEKKFGSFESVLNNHITISEDNAKWLNSTEPQECGFLFQNNSLVAFGELSLVLNSINTPAK